MDVRWSTLAADDLERICRRIERDNPEAALRVVRTIYKGCGRLENFPSLGHQSIRMPGRRELMFPPLPYIVVYQITQHARRNLAHYHGAQDWP